jgi:signal transduction histidine kinase/HAMP domain-containing protein
VLTSFVFLPNLDWAVFVEQPLSEAYRPLYGSVSRTSTLLLIGLGIALLASGYMARRVVRPLEVLRAGVEQISKGDLDHHLEIKTGDEIEILANEFNKMVGELRKSYGFLEEKVQQRTKELSALFDITTTASRSLEINDVLIAVTKRIKETFRFDTTRIYLFGDSAEELHLRAEFGDALECRKVFQKGHGLLGQAAHGGEAIFFEDIQCDERYEQLSVSKANKEAGYRSLGYFPILVAGKSLGCVVYNGRQPRKLTGDEIRLLRSMCDQIGVAINNINLFEEVKEKTSQLGSANLKLVESLAGQTAIAEVLRAMARSPNDLRVLLDTMIINAVTLARANGGVIRLYDNTGAFRFVAYHGDKGLDLPNFDLPLRADEQSASTRAIRELQPVHILDISSEGHRYRGPIQDVPARTVLAVPMLRQDSPLGVIVVFRYTVEAFTDQQIEMVTTFADQAVIAMENVRLFQELQKRSGDLAQSVEKLEDANQRLTELDKLKSDFISNVSHELRTPLTAVESLTDNMLDGITGPLNNKQIRYVSGIKDSADRLARLIDDLLDLSVIEAGRLELKRESFSLTALILAVADSLTPMAEEKLIRLKADGMDADWLAWGDRDKITQVLTNLIGNAIKFTPANGEVSLRIQRDGAGWLKVSVVDTGPGVAPEEATKIFSEFYQLRRAGEKKSVGVGLGLAISKKLVEMHGGKIWVENTVGNGSNFSFTVPTRQTLYSDGYAA